MTMTRSRPQPRADGEPPPDLLTIAEVAHALRWNATTARRHLNGGVIAAWAVVRLPRYGRRTSYRIKRAWLARVLAGKGKE